MKRVAEIIYVVESERESFLKGALDQSGDTPKVLWKCGVRKQQYFALNDFIFMTFEYKGNDFAADMEKMASYLDSKGLLIKKRRKDVPPEERATTNWWAPVKKLGSLLEADPNAADIDDSWELECMGMTASAGKSQYDTAFDDDDWTEFMRM